MLTRQPSDPSSREMWQRLVRGSRPGTEATGGPAGTPGDGLLIEPLCDSTTPLADGAADPFPFPRPEAPSSGKPWEVRQMVSAPTPMEAQGQVREDLDGGADSVHLSLDPGGHRADGVRVKRLADVAVILDGVDLGRTPLGISAGPCGHQGPLALAALVGVARHQGLSPNGLKGHALWDPGWALAQGSSSEAQIDATWDRAADLLRWTRQNARGMRVLGVDTTGVHDRGAGPIEELAVAILGAMETLGALERRGVSPADVCPHLTFTLRLGPDLLGGVAACRALRVLWANVADHLGVEAPMDLQVRQSTRDLDIEDPWNNILVGTAAAFAGALGGADVVIVEPFDGAFDQASPEARRLARNTQLVLLHEGGLGKVADPAGGAWAFERLTEDLARGAWDLAQVLEEDGGLARGLSAGLLHERLAAGQRGTDERRAARAKRQIPAEVAEARPAQIPWPSPVPWPEGSVGSLAPSGAGGFFADLLGLVERDGLASGTVALGGFAAGALP